MDKFHVGSGDGKMDRGRERSRSDAPRDGHGGSKMVHTAPFFRFRALLYSGARPVAQALYP
eukprot:1186146-Rhodomonas_salina.1